jgi:hypothetical protein
MTAKKVKKRAKKRSKRRPARRRAVKKRQVRKKPVRRRRAIAKSKITAQKPKEKMIGIVTHYFPKVRAAAIKLKIPLALWDNIRIKGHTTDFTQVVSSLQIDRQPITKAKRGQEIGLLVSSRVRRNDLVYQA